SYAYWKDHFGGDRGIVGRQVEMNGNPMTVIGVAPRSFRGLNTLLAVQAYMPLAMVVTIEKTPLKQYNDVSSRGMSVYARLAPGMTAERANTALAVVARRLAADHPRKERDAGLRTFGLSASRAGGFNPNNNLKEVAALFLALAAMVLLLACVNVANLVLVRASIREREMVVRSALGAQRSRLIRQMLTESVLLGLLGGAVGVALGLWASSVLGAANLGTDLPLRLYFGFDWHVFAFSAGIAVAAGLLVGIAPAARMARADLNRVLREGGRGVAGRSSRFRDALVALQVAAALMLLVVAGLFTRTLRKTEHASLGFNPAHVLLLSMDPGEIGYNSSQARDFYGALMERVRDMPGVRSATMAGATPMGMIDHLSDTVKVPGYEVPRGQAAPTAGYNVIGADYFRTLEIPLAEGRSFTKADNKKGAYVAIVSEAMAKKFWPHEDAIGREFTMGSDAKHPMRVVGVAKNARYLELQGPIRPYFYVPYLQHPAVNTLNSLEIRTEGDPAAMIPEMERTIHGIAPNLPVFEVKTLHEALYSPNGLLPYEVIAALAGVLGTLGLVLAMVGVYGVLSYVVRQKTGEIGVRMALGAQRGDILRIVYRHGLWIVGIGLALGLAAGFGAAHVMRSMISVSATDPVTFLGVPAILAAIAMAACYIPARRAMRVEPMQALRME
ncbi:MAG: ADOP family duplicated permease, partial [Acidobacteriota bacterium]